MRPSSGIQVRRRAEARERERLEAAFYAYFAVRGVDGGTLKLQWKAISDVAARMAGRPPEPLRDPAELVMGLPGKICSAWKKGPYFGYPEPEWCRKPAVLYLGGGRFLCEACVQVMLAHTVNDIHRHQDFLQLSQRDLRVLQRWLGSHR